MPVDEAIEITNVNRPYQQRPASRADILKLTSVFLSVAGAVSFTLFLLDADAPMQVTIFSIEY